MTEARRTIGRLRRFAAAAAAVAAAGACLGALACTRSAPARRLVAATVFPVFDLTRRVADDRLDVRLILAPGLDPHDYEPRPKDVAGLADASLIFAVGLGLDPWAHGPRAERGRGRGARLRARARSWTRSSPRPASSARSPSSTRTSGPTPSGRSARWTSSSRPSPASTPREGRSTASGAAR